MSSKTYSFFSRLRYRYEVTLGLYMLTTTEKIVLNFIFVSFFTMLVLSSWFYLPSHVAAISRHVQYYLASDGDEGQLVMR